MASSDPVGRRKARGFGLGAETMAACLLRLKGYRVLARNFATPSGEIDIIAARGRTIAFVEVKARLRLETALAALKPAQIRRQRRAIAFWLGRHPPRPEAALRCDLIAIGRGRLPIHIPNAYPLALD